MTPGPTATPSTAAARVRDPDAAGIAAAVAALRAGRLVGLPTETVYGLAGDALDEGAVRRIFAAKGRPADNPLIVHVPGLDAVRDLVVEVTPLARALASRFWPGPLTLVLEASSRVPELTRAGLRTVAVRVPDHPVATTVLETSGLPLAAPSANRSGRPSPTRPEHVVADLGADVEVVLDGGPCVVGVESTVVDARGTRPIVLRDGAVTREDLGAGGAADPGEQHRSPGTRYAHYAPDCRVEVVEAAGQLQRRAVELGTAGERLAVVAPPTTVAGVTAVLRTVTGPGVVFQRVVRDEVALARELYGAFLAAEEAGADRLLVQAVPEQGVGRAVMDRLRRAAGDR
jgi:L-threonylcarbamoyladenylate synthase